MNHELDVLMEAPDVDAVLAALLEAAVPRPFARPTKRDPRQRNFFTTGHPGSKHLPRSRLSRKKQARMSDNSRSAQRVYNKRIHDRRGHKTTAKAR